MSKKTAHFILFLSTFLSGISFVSMKYLTGVFPLNSLIFVRFFIATLFLWTLLLYKRKKDTTLQKLKKSDYKIIIFTGFLGIIFYFYFQSFAFKFLSASMTALLCTLVPIFSLAAEVIFYKKKPSATIYLLSLFSLYGVYLVLNMTLEEFFSSNAILGVFLMLLSILSWVIYTMVTTDIQDRYDSLSLLTFQMTTATVVFASIALKDLAYSYDILVHNDNILMIILTLLFISIGNSALAHLFYIQGMKVIGIQLASLYMNVIPIITAFTSYIIFKSSMNGRQLLGMVIVISSIIIINKIDAQLENTTESLVTISDH